VYSVPAESATAFAERESRRTGLQVEAVATAEEAVSGTDLICTTTTATEPVVLGDWVSPGAHVNAVGAYTPTTRELDSGLVARARLYADRRESLQSEAGEFLIPKAEGLIGDDHIVGEIGDVLTGKAAARTSPDEITLFKSLGIAIEDLASAHRIYEICRERDLGTWVEIGGAHFGATEA
jgi:ornithine cyclodeaminase